MQRFTKPRSVTMFAVVAGLTLAGCGSSVGLTTPSRGTSKTGTTKSGGSTGMAGMNMVSSGSTTAVPEINGIKPVPMQIIADSYWEGMEIRAQTMTPIPFMIYTGTRTRIVHPMKHASFHLMILTDDEKSGEPIPYGAVWATITTSKGKVVYDNTQWPMLSAFVGPHYGNDVALPGPGRYKLTVLVSPPVAARSTSLAHVWLRQHRVVDYFTWNGHEVTSGSKMKMKSMGTSSSMDVSGAGGSDGDKGMKSVASSVWQGMKISTSLATVAPYVIYNGSSIQTVKAPRQGVGLIVRLDDAHTGEAIPYSTVTATVRNSSGKVVYRGQQLRTVSPTMGPTYSNNVPLPGPGRYELTLKIMPPVSARHKEYWHVWLHPHTVVEHFTWDGKQ